MLNVYIAGGLETHSTSSRIKNEIISRGGSIIGWQEYRSGSGCKKIPQSTNVVLVLKDLIGHSLENGIIEQAKRKNIPYYRITRRTSEYCRVLDNIIGLNVKLEKNDDNQDTQLKALSFLRELGPYVNSRISFDNLIHMISNECSLSSLDIKRLWYKAGLPKFAPSPSAVPSAVPAMPSAVPAMPSLPTPKTISEIRTLAATGQYKANELARLCNISIPTAAAYIAYAKRRLNTQSTCSKTPAIKAPPLPPTAIAKTLTAPATISASTDAISVLRRLYGLLLYEYKYGRLPATYILAHFNKALGERHPFQKKLGLLGHTPSDDIQRLCKFLSLPEFK